MIKLNKSYNFGNRCYSTTSNRKNFISKTTIPFKPLRHKPTIYNVAQVPSYPKGESLYEANQVSNQKETKQLFNWQKQWYPVQVLMNLDPNRPTPLKLLGKDLVLWRDGDQIWRCFEDMCPHRLVPLSEGRLEEDGTLQCAYHAWRFNGKGECTTMPQAEPEMRDMLCSNQRACATTFPTQEKYGLLWVWADSGKNAVMECLLAPPNVPPVFEKHCSDKNWKVSDLPYGYQALAENLLDPAHVPVSHHGLQGDRKNAKPLYFSTYETSIKGFLINQFSSAEQLQQYKQSVPKNQNGFENEKITFDALEEQNNGDLSSYKPEAGVQQKTLQNNIDKIQSQKQFQQKQSFFQFLAPCFLHLQAVVPKLAIQTYFLVVPLAPGRSRLFSKFQIIDSTTQKVRPPTNKIPRWMSHQGGNLILAQDSVFLFKQQQILQNKQRVDNNQNNSGNVSKFFYMPALADLGVFEFYKWLNSMGQGGVQFAPESVFVPPSEEELYDTYNGHTKLCKVCSTALENLKILRIGVWVSAAILGVFAICNFVLEPFSQFQVLGFSFWFLCLKGLFSGVFSGILGMAGVYLSTYIRKFYVEKFCHADN